MLQQIALRTGGEFIYARDIAELDEKIKELPGLKPVSEFKKDRVSFHEFWWVLVLLLVMLSVKWVVRKLHSML
ncbi:MAG: hypothetical protein KDD63_22865 [Bacteroidetes bacterium]|nr:hypothetical protein [Bacteroidota bacterium]